MRFPKTSFFKKREPPPNPVIHLSVEKCEAERTQYQFTQNFKVGRDETCQVRFSSFEVSRIHIEVFFQDGHWWIKDLESSNGTFIDFKKIDTACLVNETRVELGNEGPVLTFTPQGEAEKPAERASELDEYVEHYFGDSGSRPAGERTLFIRQAYSQIQQKQKWRYGKIIAALAVLFVIVGGYAVYQHVQIGKQRELALNIFYSMKALELDIARVEQKVKKSNDRQLIAKARSSRVRQQEMRKNYKNFIKELGVYSNDLSEDEKLILQVAGTFGECELNMPAGFVREVKNYIKKWQATDRYSKAIKRAERYNYTLRIAETILDVDLPPQFFYLALQESDFNINTSGPKTRFGIAKGIWQFIPATARKYGLRIGPLSRYRRPDRRDDRFDFEKSTAAAANYLRDIYDTEAQASGLLVMASYNWGEHRVNALINKLPENPQERNFWRLLERFKNEIPQQTYDYVFYIVSAAVIGENPRFFGFDFENPLADIEKTFGG